jgi:Holliday junction resolvase-like predicted endonuclease
MARLIPDLHTLRLLNSGHYRERDILAQLAEGLPADWTALHSVDWSSVHAGDKTQLFGEIDIVVMAPWGHLVLIEVKAGAVQQTPAGLVKQYGKESKSVDMQARMQHSAMRHNLKRESLPEVRLGQLLVLPDQRVASGTSAHPRERIVDSRDLPELCQRVKTAMPPAPERPLDTGRILAFLLNRFSACIDVAAQTRQHAQATRRLSSGLATWVPRITSPSDTFVIDATAGSGKTQLALTLIQQALLRQQRVAYVCFNRPLADHIMTLVSHRVDVSTVHEWALQRARQAGLEPDFTQPGIFDQITRTWIANAEAQDANLDLLIIDESQDFDGEWVATLGLRLKSGGRLYLMGDTEQALYGRDGFDLPDAVHIRCHENFRSPRQIVATLNGLHLTPTPVEAACVFEGDTPEFVRCENTAVSTVQTTEKVLKALWAEGFAPEQVVVLGWHSAAQSPVLQCDTLAGQRVRRWLGRFDAAANPVFSEGPLRAETVYRFKGQSAPVIVLTGLDFKELTEPLRRRLFVAMTRAQHKLVCVANQDAMHALERALEE